MKEIKPNSLIDLKDGQDAVILSITAGWKATKRLADLGLTPNTRIKILRKAPLGGPIEVEVRGTKVVIGRGLAAKICAKSK